MKIQRKKTTNQVAFSSLACGDTFRAVESDPDVIWMKTCCVEDDEGDIYNAVDISDGDMDTFKDYEKVIPVNITAVEE